MNIVLTLRTTCNCKITIGNNSCFLDENDNIKLKITFNDAIYLQVFPIDNSEKFSPFIAMLKYNTGLNSESDQIQILKLNNYIYEIFITPKTRLATIQNTKTKRSTKTPQQKTAIYENGKLSVLYSSKTLSFTIDKPLLKPQIYFAINYTILTSRESKCTHLYLIDEIKNRLKYYKCDLFKIKDNKLVLITKLNDYAHHLKVYEMDLSTATNNTNSYVAYKKLPKTIKNKSIIPYAFIQNIYAKDYNEARKYLEEDFNKILTPQSIKSFFGDFASISTPKTDAKPYTICLYYKTSFNTCVAKYFTFEFDEDNKITNIIETKI